MASIVETRRHILYYLQDLERKATEIRSDRAAALFRVRTGERQKLSELHGLLIGRAMAHHEVLLLQRDDASIHRIVAAYKWSHGDMPQVEHSSGLASGNPTAVASGHLFKMHQAVLDPLHDRTGEAGEIARTILLRGRFEHPQLHHLAQQYIVKGVVRR